MKLPLIRVLPVLLMFGCFMTFPGAQPPANATSPPASMSRAAIAAAEYARTAEITVLCTDGSDGPYEAGGTAIAVDENVFLTAFHVVNCAPMIMAVTINGSDYEAKLEAATSFDVARLRVIDAPKVSQVKLAMAAVGEAACVTYAMPERGRKCGELNPTPPLPDTEDDDDTSSGSNDGAIEMSVSVPTEHGHSGAGIWDENGALMGIVTQMRFCGGDDSTSESSCGTRGAWLATRPWLTR